MTDNRNRSWENLVAAAYGDEYAEYDLSDDLTLITDWEGDGFFTPYVQPTGDRHGAEYEREVDDLLIDLFPCDGVEWDENNGVFHVVGAEKPKR